MTQKMFNAYEESIRVPLIWSNTEYFKGVRQLMHWFLPLIFCRLL